MPTVRSKIDYNEINYHVTHPTSLEHAPDTETFSNSAGSGGGTFYFTSHYNLLVPTNPIVDAQFNFYVMNAFDGKNCTINLYDNDTSAHLYSQTLDQNNNNKYVSFGARNFRLTVAYNTSYSVVFIMFMRRAQYPIEEGMFIMKWKNDYSTFETGLFEPTIDMYNNNLFGGKF